MRVNLSTEITVYCEECGETLESYGKGYTDGTVEMWVKPCTCELEKNTGDIKPT